MAIAIAATFFAAGSAAAAPNRPASPPPTDYWQKLGFLNMAHQGGERENPGNTMFAFKKALADGADAIDMDLTLTQDGYLIATHDGNPSGTSDGPNTPFRELDLSEVRTYDFAYWFSPGLATYYDHDDDSKPHPYRGIATGDVDPPAGYSRSDFQIATFDEILDEFPDTPMNIELKPYADTQATAQAAADALARHPGREKDVIVNAFSQAMIEAFHEAAPDHLALGGSLDETKNYITGKPITPTPVAVQPPDRFNLPPVVETLPLLRPHFEYDGYIAVVWPSDLDETQETDPWYQKMIDQGASAINTMFPSRLHDYLCKQGIPAADGGLRCAEQQCPEGFTGFAPNCEEIPKCPDGVGTPPNCEKGPPPQGATVTKLAFNPKKVKLKPGQKRVLTLAVTASSTGYPSRVNVALKSSNRQVKVPSRITLNITPGKTIRWKVTVKATRKAKGKASIAATSFRATARAQIQIKPTCKAKSKKGRKGGRLCGKTDHL